MSDDKYNGRVPNAILSTKLDSITELLKTVIAQGEKREDRIGTLEACEARTQEWKMGHAELHRIERGILGTLSVVGNAVAGLAGVFIKSP